ncbi:MAG: tRNA (adenosine(37)-N6)-threonylcarbamoyltransferase complex dimerization subunit type 1 TsaB [Acidocella sp.]|nr:tRNA (adenosine(37)-N6)-threonylcarbamoyltransferase complex dimerization subunit type 1 TsaB [Acidocella sp.]
MSWLALDASGGRAGLAVLGEDGAVRHRVFAPLRPGLIETLPVLLAEAVAGESISNVAVTIGPGSFTGLRTSIALAQGYAAAAGVPLWGVPVEDAYHVPFPQLHRPLWVVVRARRGRVFVLRDGVATGYADADMPGSKIPFALAGDVAQEMAARLAARGVDVMLTNAKAIDPVWVARAAQAHRNAGLTPKLAQPIYVDPPEAKLPAAGLRPPPV